MTLIIFARCKNGITIISERQGTREDRRRKFVKKIHSNSSKSIFLALSGPEIRIRQIYDTIEESTNHLKTNERTILRKIISSTHFDKNDDVSGILFLKEKNKYIAYTISTASDNTSIYEEDEPIRCYGIGGAQNDAELLAEILDLEKKELGLAVDSLVQILNIITPRYDGVGTIHNGFDIIAIDEKGVIFEKYRFQKKDLKSKIMIKADTKILKSFVKTSPKTKTKIIKRKSRKKERKTTKDYSFEIARMPVLDNTTSFTIPETTNLFSGYTSKCTECGNELQSYEGLGLLNHGKCTNCSNKPITITGLGLGYTSKCTECGNELQSYEGLGLLNHGKCTNCSNKPITITGSGIENLKCTECGNELQSYEGLGPLNHGKCTSCSNKTFTITGLGIENLKCTECGNELQPYEYGKCTSCSNKTFW